MKKYDITRTFYETAYTLKTVKNKDNTPFVRDLGVFTIVGTTQFTKEQIAKKIQDKFPNEVLFINIEGCTSFVRGMSIDTFLENSEVCDRPKSQRKKD